MTKVVIFRNEEGKIAGFNSEGRAGLSPEGKDIVCAGVSSLMQTAVIGLEGYLKLEPRVEQDKGWLKCELERDYFLDREVDAILETMLLGLYSIEREYPDHLEIEEVTNNVKV